MKKFIFPKLTAALFLLGLMANIGCPAGGSEGGGGMCGSGEMPPMPANCPQGQVDHKDGKGCVRGDPAATGGNPGGGTGPVVVE